MNKCCGACRYCDRSTFDQKAPVGEMSAHFHVAPCRRYPPVMGLDANNCMGARFPLVDPEEDWCGEYIPYDDGFWTFATFNGSTQGTTIRVYHYNELLMTIKESYEGYTLDGEPTPWEVIKEKYEDLRQDRR